MNFKEKVIDICTKKNSLLCVGLDTDIAKIPEHLRHEEDPLFAFNKAIIDATLPYAASYKVNLAFYEAFGLAGWKALEKTFKYLPDDIISIADAKRGDIGNTAKMYAKAILEELDADSITVNAYMGFDSAEPFLQNEEKGVFFLCLTSNPGSKDFQHFSDGSQKLYEKMAVTVNSWNERQNCGLVVGATHPDELEIVRNLTPELPFLIPGLGAQGGDAEGSVKNGTNENGHLALFNSSRGIIYSSTGTDFAESAKHAAIDTQKLLNQYR